MKEVTDENVTQMTVEAKRHLEQFKQEFQGIAGRVMSDLICTYIPFIESDAWTNYRQYLKDCVEQEYMSFAGQARVADVHWARAIRQRIYADNKEELTQGLIKDLQAEIENLKEQLSNRRFY